MKIDLFSLRQKHVSLQYQVSGEASERLTSEIGSQWCFLSSGFYVPVIITAKSMFTVHFSTG